MIKYEFPCYPNDEVWLVEKDADAWRFYCRSAKVQKISFTTQCIQIELRELDRHSFNKIYTWGKNVFATEQEALAIVERRNKD